VKEGRATRCLRIGSGPAPAIWISSAFRGPTPWLREFRPFGQLDFLGFAWFFSSEMSLFNGLCATPREFYWQRSPFFGK
jgi:hypothetical protein